MVNSCLLRRSHRLPSSEVSQVSVQVLAMDMLMDTAAQSANGEALSLNGVQSSAPSAQMEPIAEDVPAVPEAGSADNAQHGAASGQP